MHDPNRYAVLNEEHREAREGSSLPIPEPERTELSPQGEHRIPVNNHIAAFDQREQRQDEIGEAYASGNQEKTLELIDGMRQKGLCPQEIMSELQRGDQAKGEVAESRADYWRANTLPENQIAPEIEQANRERDREIER